MNHEYWTHDELSKIDGLVGGGRISVLPEYKKEVLKRA